MLSYDEKMDLAKWLTTCGYNMVEYALSAANIETPTSKCNNLSNDHINRF